MSYKMFDTRGRGDSGNMSMAITPSLLPGEASKVVIEHNARPRVGVFMRVGSAYARSFTSQDWWQTTPVEEILEEEENYVKFRTVNGSIYEWFCGV